MSKDRKLAARAEQAGSPAEAADVFIKDRWGRIRTNLLFAGFSSAGLLWTTVGAVTLQPLAVAMGLTMIAGGIFLTYLSDQQRKWDETTMTNAVRRRLSGSPKTPAYA